MRTLRLSLAGMVILVLAFAAQVSVLAAQSADDESVRAELASVTLDGQAIPEELAGILFFRKVYPTVSEISYTRGFIPPNTFARHVESGELAIRPVSETRVVRDGSTWADAELVAVGEEAVMRAGDTFVMHEVPWDEHGPQALGEMWTPGEDARVVGFAIRETSRCCAMTHAGMQSPWHGTLVAGVDEMRGDPVTLRILRWEVPIGGSLPGSAKDVPTIRFLDAGRLSARSVTDDPGGDATEPLALDFTAGRSLQLPKFVEDPESLLFENTGAEPAVVYELLIEPESSAQGEGDDG